MLSEMTLATTMCVTSFTFLLFGNCIVENRVTWGLSTRRRCSRGKTMVVGSLGLLVLTSGGKTNFVSLVSGVLHAWGWLWGSKGGLLRSWDHVYVEGGNEIPREFHLFDACPLFGSSTLSVTCMRLMDF